MQDVRGFEFGTRTNNFDRRKANPLDFAPPFVLGCFYTGKEDDPAYEQRFFEMYGT